MTSEADQARADLIAALPEIERKWGMDRYEPPTALDLLIPHLPALLAAVRECEELRADLNRCASKNQLAYSRWSEVCDERDALRAENDRLRGELAGIVAEGKQVMADEHMGLSEMANAAIDDRNRLARENTRLYRVAEAAKAHRVQEDADANCTAFDESIAALGAALADAPEEPT